MKMFENTLRINIFFNFWTTFRRNDRKLCIEFLSFFRFFFKLRKYMIITLVFQFYLLRFLRAFVNNEMNAMFIEVCSLCIVLLGLELFFINFNHLIITINFFFYSKVETHFVDFNSNTH